MNIRINCISIKNKGYRVNILVILLHFNIGYKDSDKIK